MIKAKIISIHQDAVDIIIEDGLAAGRKTTIPGVWSAELIITATDLSFEKMTTFFRNGTEFELVPKLTSND